MDMNSLMLSLLFGAVGTGFLMYGKKMAAAIPMLAGVGLIVVPYFISNLILLSLVGAALTAVPFVVRSE
ncbi:MAG TPA: hypothetical protein VK797_26745 [Tepidisphaeraceae bacterium]|jgi:hypothetical protein|nr:hypothetical protein [Tepidisphaeraceae bacterium]